MGFLTLANKNPREYTSIWSLYIFVCVPSLFYEFLGNEKLVFFILLSLGLWDSIKYPFSFKINRMIVVVDGKRTVGNFISITPIFVVQ